MRRAISLGFELVCLTHPLPRVVLTVSKLEQRLLRQGHVATMIARFIASHKNNDEWLLLFK
jgi:hypothetical protein